MHAIEASPAVFTRLQRNLAANGTANVTAHNLAVADRCRHMTVYLHDARNLGGTTVVASEAALLPTSREQMVEGRPLADIVPQPDLRRARVIKIDVEGAEWLVLRGMRDVLPKLAPDAEVLVEVNVRALRSFGASLRDLLELFAEAGFAPFEVRNGYDARHYLEPPAAPVPLCRELEFGDLLFRRNDQPARTWETRRQ